MNFKNLLVEKKDGISEVIINRPDKLNALNYETLCEIYECFSFLEKDDETKVIIVSGAGDKAFVAGADIKELSESNPIRAEEISLTGQRSFRKIETLKKVVIARIQGYALGGGLELALSCHLRYGSEKAILGQPEINLGVITGFAGSQRLPKLIGKGRALEMLLTGETIKADKAYELGLLNGVFKSEELKEKVNEVAEKIKSKAPIAVSSMITAVNRGNELNIEDGGRFEASLFGLLFSTADLQEGMLAFLEKRKAEFKGK